MSGHEKRTAQARVTAPHISYEPGVLKLIDQTKLPGSLELIGLTSAVEVAQAIRDMRVRGAPAIGIAAAYGMAIAARAAARDTEEAEGFMSLLAGAASVLERARPTAVNLSWAVRTLMTRARELARSGIAPARIADELASAARRLHQDDIEICRRIGDAGASLILPGSTVLTHCNTGDLATGGYGTALGIIRSAWRDGKLRGVFVDETRPLLQGARLTAWELGNDGIPNTLITDSMAAHFMQRGSISAVVVGADRIARNGDTANKIGSYGLAVLAHAHGIPFIVAAPCSSFDAGIASGADIPIEERDPQEILAGLEYGTSNKGAAGAVWPRIRAANPAFDVTPADYVSAIVTEFGVLRKPFEPAIEELLERARPRPDASLRCRS